MNFSGVSNRTLFGRAIRLPLRLLPPETRVIILQGKLRGRRWIAGSSNHGCWLGSYEYGKRKEFEKTVQEGDVVYDVGAHVGYYSLLASVLAGPRGRVFAFEPLPRNVRYLNLHLALNRVTNVTIVEAAVADVSGTACFESGPNHSMGQLGGQGPLQVSTLALDDVVFARGLPAPAVIKVDVEGAEKLVLKGSARILSTYHPVVFLASHSEALYGECSTFLRSLGYNIEPLRGTSAGYEDETLARWCR